MGSQSRKKKKTASTPVILDEIKRDTDLNANKAAIQPTFEGTAYSPILISQIDFINVSTKIGSTQTGAPIEPQLDMHLDNNTNDSSTYIHTITGSNSNGFVAPGQFGSHGWKCNTPVLPGVQPDVLQAGAATNPTELQMDTSTGFSISLWVYPTDLSALTYRRVVVEKPDDANNMWSIQIDSAGIGYFFVKKGGTEYKRQKTGFVTGSWQHIGATFNGSTNTSELYRDAVAGASSVATGQYPSSLGDNFQIGKRSSGAGGDGSDFDTHYIGYYDEIKYYRSVVLTSTQVTNLKNTNAL